MRFIDFVMKDGLFEKKIEFSSTSNLIYSQDNTVGKTTLLRALLYALGYPIPSTKGINFDNMIFKLTLENNEKIYVLERKGALLELKDGDEEISFSVPTDSLDVLAYIMEIENKDILNNLLGAFYVDQEKGWTLLNRGKVIGNISFNIESLVRGLAGKDCNELLRHLEVVKRQKKKYEYMLSVASYQEEISESSETLVFESPNEALEKKIEILQAEKVPISIELRQIQSVMRKNKLLAEYIAEMNLIVINKSGVEIPVTKETLLGFSDNAELLATRKEMLSNELNEINRKIAVLENEKNKEQQLFVVQTAIEEFDSNINKIKVDAVATQSIINSLKKQKKDLENLIRKQTKADNTIVQELHDCISTYAKELNVDEKYVSPLKDYIFTNDLKSLSGTVLHKIVFSFKLAYIKIIKEKTGITLPIVMDSPSGREVVMETVEEMLKIVQRDFSEHQIVIASIYNFDLREKKTIELKERLFTEVDLVTI